MLRKILGLAIVLMLVAAPAARVHADTITLKNGREVNGKIVDEKKDFVMFKVLQGTIKILKRDIATFTEDDNIGLDKIGKPRADAIKPEPETSGKGPDASDDEKAAITKL